MEIARVFFDIHMGLSFRGLSKVMQKVRYNPDVLPNGKFTLFINRKHTAFKLLVGQSYLVYHTNKGRRFPLEAIREFPNHFDGRKIDVAGAICASIEKKYLSTAR